MSELSTKELAEKLDTLWRAMNNLRRNFSYIGWAEHLPTISQAVTRLLELEAEVAQLKQPVKFAEPVGPCCLNCAEDAHDMSVEPCTTCKFPGNGEPPSNWKSMK